MEILNEIFKAIESYFNAATKLGYVKDSDLDKLLVYIFIQEILEGDMSYFVDEKDFRLMEKALSCLFGTSCLLPYPQHANDDNLFGHLEDDRVAIVRLKQEDLTRSTEDNRVRFKAYN